jgi:hypothetical protein
MHLLEAGWLGTEEVPRDGGWMQCWGQWGRADGGWNRTRLTATETGEPEAGRGGLRGQGSVEGTSDLGR